MPEASAAALAGLDLWIVDALRYHPHPSHFSVDDALDWIERIKPQRAILTNMHTDLDYEVLRARLPPNVGAGLSTACGSRSSRLADFAKLVAISTHYAYDKIFHNMSYANRVIRGQDRSRRSSIAVGTSPALSMARIASATRTG